MRSPTQRPTQHRPSAPPGGAPRGAPPRRPHAAHSLPIGRLFGIPLEVHWTFLALVALVVALGAPAGAAGVIAGLIWIGALFASVVVHELAHCLVARRRGGEVLGILLLPIGGLSRMARIPSDPRDESAVALAGPATSVALGLALLLLGALAFGSALWPPSLVAGGWAVRLGWLNLLLAAFNLVPALPMDGGRVLRAALARRMPRARATWIAATVAKVIAAALVAAGVLVADLWLIVIGVFVYLGASGEQAQARRGPWDGDDPRAGARGGPDPRQWGPPQWPSQGWPPPQWPPQWAPPQWGPPPGWAPPVPDPRGWDAPSWPTPQWTPPSWPPPQGPPSQPPPTQWPPPRPASPPEGGGGGERSALDVPVEGRGPDAGGTEPRGERVGQHH